MNTHISSELDLTDAIKMLNDRNRVEWITALLETIQEEGTIGTVRELVNDPKWNDQEMARNDGPGLFNL